MIVDRGLESELASPKYARAELERRWLVDPALRPAIDALDFVLIEDRYLSGTRMRLRRMTRSDGWSAYKLTKKYETERPEARPIVTTYLTEAEHALLANLPGRLLRKNRYYLPHAGLVWSLDLFEGALVGLELAEVEVPDEAALAALVPPPWTVREVTHDVRYQCGSLVEEQRLPEV